MMSDQPKLPDQPPLPPTTVSPLVKVYGLFAGAVVIGYLAIGVLGWDVEKSGRERVPPNVRTSPGGYRSFHFWHSGYHGGK
jgi:hypothetical protein